VTVGAPPPPAAFQRPPTAQEAVLQALRTEILAGALRPGERIVQESLAERYGVSRVPLREALRILEGEGQVTYLPHRGYVVAQLSLADLTEVYRLRELLEPEAISAAVPRLDRPDIDRLVDLSRAVDDAAAGGDLLALADANRRFHFAIFEAADRPRLVRLLRQLWDATDAYRSVYFAVAGNRRRVSREHAALLRAIRNADVAAAIAAQAAHRDHSVATLRTVLTDSAAPTT
jgi:DNA-binding GntR family transcriptional regulator